MRYQRQVILPEIGMLGQQRLQQASVLCVGVGGLGSPALMYLAAAGMGRIGIQDGDVVALHNLQRQVLFREMDIGELKSKAALKHLQQLNQTVRYEEIPRYLTANNALKIVNNYDYILDCSDNMATKLLLNDACFTACKPLISAAVERFQGQLLVYWPSKTGCLRCLYSGLDTKTLQMNCETTGVLGVMPGILGIQQALQVLKIVLRLDDDLFGKLYDFDGLTHASNAYHWQQSVACGLCTKKTDFARLWGVDNTEQSMQSHQITVQALAERLEKSEPTFLLDVRNEDEHAAFNIGGELIPLSSLADSLAKIPLDLPIVVYCRSGYRSQLAVEYLQQQGFQDVKNLVGGMLAWQQLSLLTA